MDYKRVSRNQKAALLQLLLLELNTGRKTSLSGRKLFDKSLQIIQKEPVYNHFYIGLIELENRGYLLKELNANHKITKSERSNACFWSLTKLGRQKAEYFHSQLTLQHRLRLNEPIHL